jgi:hypothetical protein
MKDREHDEALRLLKKHPGWGDRRVAAELSFQAQHGRLSRRRELRAWTRSAPARWIVTPRAVTGWRNDAGLAPALPTAARHKGPRRDGVRLACGHGLGAPVPDDHHPAGWCWRCHRWQDLAPDHDTLQVDEAARARLLTHLERTPPLPEDTAPSEPEAQKHWIDRRAADVARDLFDRARYGPLPRDPRAAFVEVLRRGGIAREEAERIADYSFGGTARG